MTKRSGFIAALVIVAVGIAAAVLLRRPAAPVAVAVKKGAPQKAVALQVSAEPATPVAWADVHAPAKAWKALRANAWTQRVAADPLGRGFLSEWAGVLGTRGADLGGSFQGAVLDLLADQLLADPFRLVFYGGGSATGTPALVVPKPSAAASSAFDLLEGVARRGSYTATHCPGTPDPDEKEEAKGKGELPAKEQAQAKVDPGPAETRKPAAPAAPTMVVSRWLIAEQSIFAARAEGRLVLARSPAAVVQALCNRPPQAPAGGADLTVTFSREVLGREGTLSAALLGLGPETRLAFAIEGDHLVPQGLSGQLGAGGRLDAAAPSQALLDLVPADAGVVLLATLRLPDPLDRAALKAHLAGAWQGKTATRTVALLWNPRGDERQPTEVALAWPERDAALLEEAFSGPNRLDQRRACGHLVLASTGAFGQAMQQACAGKVPSIRHGPPAVAQGLAAPASLGLGVNLGAVLSRLTGEAWVGERARVEAAALPRRPAGAQPAAAPPPKVAPEIEAARRLLEELPYLGLRGTATGGALVPSGFRT
jgi:hypothetical protein